MKAVGARLPRYDGVAHVTGRTTFVDDVRVPGTLWVKALRSPVHHADITRLDTARAEAMPGVHAVITWEDVPLLSYGHLSALGIPEDEPLLAKDDVRYKGQPIALVAAENEETAMAAVDAIEIDFSEKPALFDIRLGADPDAPVVHHWGNWYPHFEGEMDVRQIRKGDIDWAFDRADVIVQGVYRPAAIEHCPLETQVCQVVPEPDGRLTIYTCSQALYFSMGVVAAHLQLPLSKLKLVGGTVGGGFGGKVDTATETVCALLAMKSGRPVKWRWTREEEFLCSSTRAPWHMEIADAVTSDGWILGRKMLTLHDSGAYARFSPYGVTKHSFHHTGAYTIPNLSFDGAHDRHARLRRHVRLLRGGDAHEPHRGRARHGSVRDPPEEREQDRRHVAERRRLHRSLHRPHYPGNRRCGRPRAAGRLPDDDPRPPRRRVASRPLGRAGRRPRFSLMRGAH
jgi:CO/xanthine dehydrogenase Mo-binding subunit